MAERLTISGQFDTGHDKLDFQKTLSLHGAENGQAILLKRISKNMESQLWEAFNLADPYLHSYHLIPENGQTKVIHESNLDTKTDVRDVVDRGNRRGTEGRAADNYAQAMSNAKVGQTIIWVSPKKKPAKKALIIQLIKSILALKSVKISFWLSNIKMKR